MLYHTLAVYISGCRRCPGVAGVVQAEEVMCHSHWCRTRGCRAQFQRPFGSEALAAREYFLLDTYRENLLFRWCGTKYCYPVHCQKIPASALVATGQGHPIRFELITGRKECATCRPLLTRLLRALELKRSLASYTSNPVC